MKSLLNRWRIGATVASAAILLAALNPWARAATKRRVAHRTAAVKKSSKRRPAAHHAISYKKVAVRRRARVRYRRRRVYYRRSSYRYRILRIHLQPDRITEIQAALKKAGYLDEDPTGKWDDATKAAMTRYQTDNGFTPTGLPESKPLLKLGLGPHPLPTGVGADTPTTPAASPSATSGPATQSSSNSKSTKPSSPGR